MAFGKFWSESKDRKNNAKVAACVNLGAKFLEENKNFGVHSTEAHIWLPSVSLDADGYLVVMITGHRPTGDKLPGVNWENVHKDIDPRTKCRTWTWSLAIMLTKFIIWLARDCGYKKIRIVSGAAAGIDLCWARAGVNAMLVFRQAGQYTQDPAKMTPFFATAAVDQQYVGDITGPGKYADDGVDIQICMAIPCKDHQSKMKNEVLQLWRACCNIAGVYGYYDKEMASAPYREKGAGIPKVGSMEFRNRWMVAYAKKCNGFAIAIFDGSKGGTKNCVDDLKNAGVPGIRLVPKDIVFKNDFSLNFLKEKFEEIKGRVMSPVAPITETVADPVDYPVEENFDMMDIPEEEYVPLEEYPIDME